MVRATVCSCCTRTSAVTKRRSARFRIRVKLESLQPTSQHRPTFQWIGKPFRNLTYRTRGMARSTGVQKINDVIAWPVIGDPGEITQIADHDGGSYRRPASAPGGASQNEVAGMRPDVGFEQRSRQPTLHTDFADQSQNRQQFQ